MENMILTFYSFIHLFIYFASTLPQVLALNHTFVKNKSCNFKVYKYPHAVMVADTLNRSTAVILNC